MVRRVEPVKRNVDEDISVYSGTLDVFFVVVFNFVGSMEVQLSPIDKQ